MIIRGRIQNGVVIFEEEVRLPDGTEVSVVVRPTVAPATDEMAEQRQRRYREALARIDAMPNENPSDTFSGADHDRVLYGGQS